MTGPVWDGQGEDPWLPHRLDARLEVDEVERDIRNTFWAALSKWLVQLSRRVLRGEGRPDLDQVWAMVPAWREAVDLVIEQAILPAMARGYEALLGADFPWEQRVFVARYLAEVRNRMVRTPDLVFDVIAGEMSEGINLGESIPKLSARVAEVLDTTGTARWENRAVVVARSESIAALNAGRADAFEAFAQDVDGPLEKVWLCVLPGTPVVANGVTAIARRRYDGDVIEVRSALGRRVSLTPQHPVLTGRGWVAAQDLKLSDQLLSVRGIDPVGAPGVEARYAMIEECFDAAIKTREVTTLTREVRSGVDLDGDPAYEDVDVVTVYGHLAQGIEPRLAKDLARFSLEFSDETLALLVVQGTVTHGGVGVQESAFSGTAGDLSPGFGASVSSRAEDSSGALVPDRDAGDAEHAPDCIAAGASLKSDGTDGLPGLVVLDDLVSIEVVPWSGHVYDFSTYCHWFLADGIVVHNSTDDARTRPEHRAADGQRVPLDQPFIVGGFPAMFPGDPSLPPELSINCRCSTVLVEPGETVDLSNRQMRA